MMMAVGCHTEEVRALAGSSAWLVRLGMQVASLVQLIPTKVVGSAGIGRLAPGQEQPDREFQAARFAARWQGWLQPNR